MAASTFQMKIAEPSNRGRPSKLALALEFARSAGGKWCLVAEYPRRGTAASTAWEWNRRPESKEFEFTSGAVKNKRTFGVYCRLIGKE